MAKLAKVHPKYFLDVLKFLPHYFNIPELVDILVAYLEDPEISKYGFSLPVSVYDKMTVETLDSLVSKIPSLRKDATLVDTLVAKKFESLTLKQTIDDKEKLKIIKEMMKWSEVEAAQFPGYYSSLLRLAVNLCIDAEIEDEDLFSKLIDNPNRALEIFNDQHLKKINSKLDKNSNTGGVNLNKFELLKQITNRSDQGILEAYVTQQINKGKEVKDFLHIFNKKWLDTIYYTDRLQKGENFNNVTEIFTEIELNTLRDKRELKILNSNKKQFLHGEDVKLTLRFKNIHSLQVNIYEIDTLGYYLQSLPKFNELANLLGVVPGWSFKKSYQKSPLIAFDETFTFD